MDEVDEPGQGVWVSLRQYPVPEVEDVSVGGLAGLDDGRSSGADDLGGCEQERRIEVALNCFTRADAVERGRYVYDDPQAGDERVLAFGAVPPVVYSETIGDLKAIAGLAAPAGAEENDEA